MPDRTEDLAFYASMLQLLLEEPDLQKVLDSIAEREHLSLALMDMSGKILAASHPFFLEDPIWKSGIEQGCCPAEFTEFIRLEYESHQSQERQSVFQSRCEQFDVEYLCIRLYIRDVLYGYLFALNTRPDFPAYLIQLFPYMKKVWLNQIRTLPEAGMGSLKLSFLQDILNGAEEEQILERMQATGWNFEPRFSLIVLRISYYSGRSYLRSRLLPELESLFSGQTLMVYEESLVILNTGCREEALSQWEKETLENLCRKENLRAGISRVFDTVLQMRSAYRHARTSIQLGKKFRPEEVLYFYDTYYLFDLLSRIPSSVCLQEYCHPALQRLRQQDEKNGGSLYETLYALTVTNFSSSSAAKKLYIHRNTMNYRRQRIEEIGGICLEDPVTRFQLQISVSILEYLEKAAE